MNVFPYESQIILVLGLCLGATFLLRIMSKRLNPPQMIPPLIIGLLLNYALGHGYFASLSAFKDIILTFANFGVIIVLFFIGLGVDFHFLKKLTGNSSVMALNAAFIPFLLGLFTTFFFTRDIIQSLFVGLAITITAEEVTVDILEELKLMKTRLGQLIIETGVIGDVFEIMAIALLTLFIKSQTMGTFTLVPLLIELFSFLFFIIVMRYYVIDWLMKSLGTHISEHQYFSLALIVLLLTTIVSELLNFSYIIGALVAGILLKDKLLEDKLYVAKHHIMETIKVFNFGVFHPIIFIWIGLSIDFSLIFLNLPFGIILTVVALFGKLIGSTLGNYFCKESMEEGFLIGWGLNPRGATELFALLVAKNEGIVSQDIFSAVVFMALITTIISPVIFKYMAVRGYGLVSAKKGKKAISEA